MTDESPPCYSGMAEGICSVESCGGDSFCRGWCIKHYTRVRRHGDPHHVERGQRALDCPVEGCTEKQLIRGLCQRHYDRKYKRKSDVPLHEDAPRGRPRKPTDEIGYGTVHHRLRGDRGPASLYPCIDCGGRADDWSYRGDAPDERVDKREHPFSGLQDYYDPRCRPCHLKYDGGNPRWRGRDAA